LDFKFFPQILERTEKSKKSFRKAANRELRSKQEQYRWRAMASVKSLLELERAFRWLSVSNGLVRQNRSTVFA
jgi:hypothetical protein